MSTSKSRGSTPQRGGVPPSIGICQDVASHAGDLTPSASVGGVCWTRPPSRSRVFDQAAEREKTQDCGSAAFAEKNVSVSTNQTASPVSSPPAIWEGVCSLVFSTANDGPCQDSTAAGPHAVDELLARLTEQQAILDEQNGETFKAADGGDDDGGGNVFTRNAEQISSSSSLPITPAADAFPTTTPSTRPASASLESSRPEAEEVLRLKLQLAQAQSQISKLDQELAKTRLTKPEPDTQNLAPSRGMPAIPRETTWGMADDAQSDTSDVTSATAFNRARGIWGSARGSGSFASNAFQAPGNWFGGRGFGQGFADSNQAYPALEGFRSDRVAPDSDLLMRPPGGRRGGRYDNRMSMPNQFPGGFGGVGAPVNQLDSMPAPMPLSGPPALSPMGMGIYQSYQQQPVGTPLSPHASEFTSKAVWKNEVGEEWRASRLYGTDRPQGMPTDGPTYLPATEPLNYRRLLDKNVSANWKYIVDKIVCNNDQQASIFLQQKLKVGSPEQKYEIVEAIVAQAYPLMVNRFGNFLVQRCFEHGTPEQVIKIAEAIRGNTLNLSMDPFGCHVVQKAFDSVPEDYKAIMVHELLRRIPETVIHRYACHVWQKLFELRWTESPPQIMKYVNEALRGMWHEVALGETGSLVVQNIFENCLEEDKARREDGAPCYHCLEVIADALLTASLHRRGSCQH